MEYILFDDINTYNDFGLLVQEIIISEPPVKEEYVDIPGGDGKLDFSTALTGDVKYDNRTITIKLAKVKNENCYNEYSNVQNALHGKNMKIILSKDPNFYYIGKVKVKDFERYTVLQNIVIECDVEPYKYDLTSSAEDWLWNPFSFENGIINETKEIEVTGSADVVIYGRRKKVSPWITCENAMQVIFDSRTYNLTANKQKVLDILISEGKNTLKFVGNGKVTIDYRGGSL
ncbi:MAG: mtfA protein [Clostridia bacterium]|nr:mtfA protein [Clostridia bacterium]